MRTLKDILAQFPQARDSGLKDTDVTQSLQKFGANRLTPLPREPLWKKFIGKFDEAIIKILLAATLLKTVVDLFPKPVRDGELPEDPDLTLTPGLIGLGMVVGTLLLVWILRQGRWIPMAMFGLALVLVGISVGIGHPSWEGLAVMVAVVLATGVAFISEFKSDKEFEALNTRKDSLKVKVMRHGGVSQYPLEEVVVGDLVILEMGDEIPADGRVVKSSELMIDQSLLTGESEAVRKKAQPLDEASDGPDQPGCLYRGTQVVDGAAQMIVSEVGDLTMIGQIARRLSLTDTDDDGDGKPESEEDRVQRKLTISRDETPLQQKLTALAGLISKVGYIAAIAIFVALLARGVYLGEVSFEAAKLTNTIANLLSYFVYMVIIIVVAVPEGLPMSVTVSLALAMRKMTRANSLVRQLVACETIGSATVICSDKTGTLTQNRMQVDRLSWDGKVFQRGQGVWPAVTGTGTSPEDWLAVISGINSTATLDRVEGRTVVIGNSTEGALLQWIAENGIAHGKLRSDYPALYQMLFTSDRKRMTTVIKKDGSLWTLAKGGPEIVLERCTTYMDSQGQSVALTEDVRDTIRANIDASAALAMRTLAFAIKKLPDTVESTEDVLHERREELESDLTFVGFTAIRDPLRPEVPEAVRRCREAGIEVKMITGDNIETAKAIGKEIGLMDSPEAIAMTSVEFNALTDDEIKAKLSNIRILARARPLDKYRMVRLLQEQEHVVAVTGDGTNDAPALKRADVGLAMGISGTEVAKEASKIVLLDDSFGTIVNAVNWGRSLYENIQRFIQFQLTINVSALAIAFLGPLFGVKPPFTVLQLLWINVIMDTFASIALCSEPPRPGLMKMKPKRRDESIVTRTMRGTILTTAVFFVVVMMALILGMEYSGWFAGETGERSKEFADLTTHQVTMFFTIYVMFQVWNSINCRSLTPERSGLTGLFKNPLFLAIGALIVVGQFAIVQFGGEIFQTTPLSGMEWLGIIAATASVLVFAEIVRVFRRRS